LGRPGSEPALLLREVDGVAAAVDTQLANRRA
jgi:hypothetical protein